jgi:hypothetical protein
MIMPRRQSRAIEPERPGRLETACGCCLRASLVPILLILIPACDSSRRSLVATVPAKENHGAESACTPAWQGVGSCAATACHGGSQAEIGSSNAYTTWIARDPHADAYAVLDGDRSHRIEALLGAPSGHKAAEAREDPRCLNCHVHPEEGKARHAATFSRQDGVGCESCHGPAQCWLELHSFAWRQGPRPPSVAEKRKLGMVPTKDLVTRATVCAGCHVGGRGREVDHDLIAAGHPRLNFELTSYLANLPRHWDDAAEKRAQPHFEARAWVIGQVVSAGAAFDVLRARADAANDEARHWPEFAEYDCFTCHHDLAEPSWRQSHPGGRSPGLLPWGSWYESMIRPLAKYAGGAVPEGTADTLTALREEMSRSLPDPRAIAPLAGRIDEQLKGWLARDPGAILRDDRSVAELLARLAEEGQTFDGRSWDHAAQLYLALAALSQAHVERGKSLGLEARAALQELAPLLRFPDGFDSPKGRGPLIPGPFGAALDRFRAGLGRAGDEGGRARGGSPP